MTPKAETNLAVVEPKPQTDLEKKHSPLMPVFSPAAMRTAIQSYRELQKVLDEEMPEQIMKIGDKMFRKKGYWRALSLSFSLQLELVKEERIEQGKDWGYRVTYKAIAPNGREMYGDGACMGSEKYGKGCTEHNVRSHAHTRAKNRAISDLVAFGEVSAEEVDPHTGEINPPANRQQKQQFAQKKADTTATAVDPFTRIWKQGRAKGIPKDVMELAVADLHLNADRKTHTEDAIKMFQEWVDDFVLPTADEQGGANEDHE